MKNKRAFIVTVLIIAVLLLGIGYAAVANKTLTISGTAKVSPDDSNFNVKFTGTPATAKVAGTNVPEDAEVTATITDDTTATIGVTGLTAKGQKVTATYTILNDSADLKAALSASLTNSNTNYFTVTQAIADPSTLAPAGTTTITVTVECIKTPVTTDETANITVTITAAPQENA